MIAKHVAMRSVGHSDFAGLVGYITDAQDKTERLGLVTMTNCEAGTVQAAIDEVLATQHLNTRAQGDKTYHLLIGFAPGEIPPAEVLAAIEARLCAGLGYAEHQRISAVHHDTDHLHLHIAINKIHPTRHTLHEPFLAYRTLGELCTALEQQYGLQRVNHEPRRRLSESRAGDMEQHSGIESLVSWIRRECLDDLRAASTWTALHQALQANGLELRERANGFVIESSDGTRVKASTVARDFSRPALEARLGAFMPSPEGMAQATSPRRSYQKPPVRLRINTVELYARYTDELKTFTAARADALAKARRRKERAIEDAKRSNRLRRATIKIVDGQGISKRVLYSQASAALQSTLESIHKDYTRAREHLYRDFQRKTWADWLRQKAVEGDSEALAALRAREAARGLKGNTIEAGGDTRPEDASDHPAQDTITKTGTIIFRVGRSAVRDDGDRLQISREITQDGLHAALRLAVVKYGERITVNGTPEFKAQVVRAAVDFPLQITFADPGLERRRLELLTRENVNDRQTSERGRTDRRGAGSARYSAVVGPRATRSGPRSEQGVGRAAGGASRRQPHLGCPGRVAPPASRHRLRTLSQLGVVRFAGGAQVLLPRDVPGHLEQQGVQPDHALRRGIPGPGLTPEQVGAMEKYIAERELKRRTIGDIPKHERYTVGAGAITFAGVRHIDGQTLVLLKRDGANDPVGSILVLPVDPTTARRAARIAVGDSVSVTAGGSLKTSKGRRR